MDFSPLQVKRILKSTRIRFENFILKKQDKRDLKKYESWLNTYLELSDDDKINILKKVDRAQAATVVYAMAQRDTSIFLNQLGCFYIKPTTTAFYNKLHELLKEREGTDFDYKEVETAALLEARKIYYRIHNAKHHGKRTKFEISSGN